VDAGGRTRLRPEERRHQLLDAAADVLTSAGSEAVTTEAIAKAAGVRRGLVHYYFGNRDAVLVALFERENEKFRAHVTAASARSSQDFQSSLRGLIDGWLEAAESQVVLDALDKARTESGTLEAARAQSALTALQEFSEAIQREFSVDRETALVTAGILLSGARAVIPARGVTGWTRDKIADHFVTMCMGAIAAVTGPT
jgi:AcrR family transcriptional regulator